MIPAQVSQLSNSRGIRPFWRPGHYLSELLGPFINLHMPSVLMKLLSHVIESRASPEKILTYAIKLFGLNYGIFSAQFQ